MEIVKPQPLPRAEGEMRAEIEIIEREIEKHRQKIAVAIVMNDLRAVTVSHAVMVTCEAGARLLKARCEASYAKRGSNPNRIVLARHELLAAEVAWARARARAKRKPRASGLALKQ